MIKNTVIIAHRGESFDAPENTLASVNLAWERGAEAVEIDVHLSKDNHVIVMHDSNTKRTAGKDKEISEQKLEELKKLDAGCWKNNKWKNEEIPTLKEILKSIPPKKKLIIEIKSKAEILPFIEKDILSSGVELNQIEFISFDYNTIVETKKTFPQSKALYLVDLDYTWYTRIISPSVNKLIAKAKKGTLDGLNVWAGKLLTKKFLLKVKSAGLLLYVWTVDNPKQAQRLIDWGIDGITTNRAQWLRSELLSKF